MEKRISPKCLEMQGLLRQLGYSEELIFAIGRCMHTDYTAGRMLRYLNHAGYRSQEELIDEMLIILEDRDRLVQRHKDDYWRRKIPLDDLFLKSFSINWDDEEIRESYVSEIMPIRNLTDRFDFHKNITFFVGENGSGKSTLLEALAIANGLNPEGGTLNYDFSTYDDHSDLKKAVRLSRGVRKPSWSYFLRAESFYNMATATNERYNDDRKLPDYHSQSHGESFLSYVQKNDAVGLYLMDEPEAALSPQRQLTLLVHLVRMAKEGSQFIIATHSPILLGTPDAEIFSFDDGFIHPVTYEETESYQVTKMFLLNREIILKELLRDECEESEENVRHHGMPDNPL